MQPSGKWLHVYVLNLTKTELRKIDELVSKLNDWNPNELKDLSSLTGRKQVKKKAVDVALVDEKTLLDHVRVFRDMFPNGKRKIAKERKNSFIYRKI